MHPEEPTKCSQSRQQHLHFGRHVVACGQRRAHAARTPQAKPQIEHGAKVVTLSWIPKPFSKSLPKLLIRCTVRTGHRNTHRGAPAHDHKVKQPCALPTELGGLVRDNVHAQKAHPTPERTSPSPYTACACTWMRPTKCSQSRQQALTIIGRQVICGM